MCSSPGIGAVPSAKLVIAIYGSLIALLGAIPESFFPTIESGAPNLAKHSGPGDLIPNRYGASPTCPAAVVIRSKRDAERAYRLRQ